MICVKYVQTHLQEFKTVNIFNFFYFQQCFLKRSLRKHSNLLFCKILRQKKNNLQEQYFYLFCRNCCNVELQGWDIIYGRVRKKNAKKRRAQSSETVLVQGEQGELCFKVHLTTKYFSANIKFCTYFKNIHLTFFLWASKLRQN